MWWRYTIIFTLLAVLPALLLFFFYSGFRGDPSKGRKRCRKCWHSLEGLPKADRGWICPECGTVARKEQHLYKRRRYWWRIWSGGLCIVLILGGIYGFVVAERWEDEGIKALIPSTPLVLMYPRTYEPFEDEDSTAWWVNNILMERRPELWTWQRNLFPEPTFETDTPDLQGAVVLPEVWIEGIDLPVTIYAERVTDVPAGRAIKLRDEAGFVLLSEDDNGWYSSQDIAMFRGLIEPLESGPTEVTFGLSYTVYTTDTLIEGRQRFDESLTLDVPELITIEEAANGYFTQPVSNEQTDRWLLLRRWIEIDVDGAWRPIRIVHPSADPLDTPGFDLALIVEIIDGEETVFRDTLCRSRTFSGSDMGERGRLLERILGADHGACNESLDRMRVRLSPDLTGAVLCREHNRYWTPANGAPYLEMSLREAINGSSGSTAGVAPLFTPSADAIRRSASIP